jgi:hypothetical protein
MIVVLVSALARFRCKPNKTTKIIAHDASRRTVTYLAWATQAGGLQSSHGHEEHGNLCKANHFCLCFNFTGL